MGPFQNPLPGFTRRFLQKLPPVQTHPAAEAPLPLSSIIGIDLPEAVAC